MPPALHSVAVALLGVVVLGGAVGGAADYLHHQPVSTDYEVPYDASVPFEHYELRFSLTDANATTSFVVDRTVSPGRSLLRADLRWPEGRTLVRRVTAGPFDYVVQRPATAERFRAAFDHDSVRALSERPDDALVSAPNGTRTVSYRLEVTGPRGRLTEATVRLDRPVRNATAS